MKRSSHFDLARALRAGHLTEAQLAELGLHLKVCEQCRSALLARLGLEHLDAPRAGGPRGSVAEPALAQVPNSDPPVRCPAEAAAPARRLADELIDAFHPDQTSPEGTVVERLEVDPIGKVALGPVVHPYLADPAVRFAFIESGSTPALEALGMAVAIKAGKLPPLPPRSADGPLQVTTNNRFIPPIFQALANVRAHYLNFSFFDKEFAGYFPVTEEVIGEAIEFYQEHVRNQTRVRPWSRSLQAVKKAWAYLLADACLSDLTLMTATGFHPYLGPFVNGQPNALLKAAYYTGGKRIVVNLSGDKVLTYAEVKEVWQKGVIQIFDQERYELLEQKWLKDVFEEADPRAAEEMKRHSTSRNPIVSLELNETEVPTNAVNNDREIVVSCTVQTPTSWDALVSDLVLKGGQVDVLLSQPDGITLAEFQEDVERKITEGNDCLGRGKSPVRLKVVAREAVRIDADTFPMLARGLPAPRDVAVYRCSYQRAKPPAVVTAQATAGATH